MAVKTLQPLYQGTDINLWIPDDLTSVANAQYYTGSLKTHLASIWHKHRAFVFCLTAGAVVRLIAPLLEDKSSDPAVVIVDQNGRFVISLCSTHQGGADELTQLIAHQIGATPVVTSASASLALPGIDILGVPFGWQKGNGNWTGVSAAIARGETVQVIQEVGATLWQARLPQKHPFYFGFPDHKEAIAPKARVWISATKRQFSPDAEIAKVQWHPRVLWIGIGCERGTSRKLIEMAIEQVCQRHHLASEAIAGIATIDIKADEVGILEYCREQNFPLKTFSADMLNSVAVPNPSNIVAQEVGTPSVAEAAAILAGGSGGGGEGGDGEILTSCLFSLRPSLIVPKQVVKLEGEAGAVTVRSRFLA